MTIKLVVCDIEGCLTINKKQPIDVGTLVKLQAYCELARRTDMPPLVLCTGRPQPYAEAILQCLDAFFPNYPSVVENGMFLYDPVEDVLIANPAIEGREAQLRQVKDYILANLAGISKLEPGKELCLSLNPLGRMSVEELFAEMQKALPPELLELVFITHSSSAVDITPQGVNKASGVRFLSERTSVKLKDMLGIGDTAGDFPMMELVGKIACPANAKQEVIDLVRQREGYVAKSPNTLGVWEILLHYNLMQ